MVGKNPKICRSNVLKALSVPYKYLYQCDSMCHVFLVEFSLNSCFNIIHCMVFIDQAPQLLAIGNWVCLKIGAPKPNGVKIKAVLSHWVVMNWDITTPFQFQDKSTSHYMRGSWSKSRFPISRL